MDIASAHATKTTSGGDWRWPTWAALLYVFGLAIVWLAIYSGADRWWFSTVLMFGPKWIYALPLPVLLAWTFIVKAGRNAWLLLGLGSVLLLFPVGGFCVPWRALAHFQPPELCVLTLNTGRDLCDAEELAALIATVEPDVVCLQETRRDLAEVFGADWTVLRAGDLVIATRSEATSLHVFKRQLPTRWPRPIGHVVRVTHAGRSFDLAVLHLLSPRYGLADITSSRTGLAPWRRDLLVTQTGYRRAESEQVSGWLAGHERPLIIAGDFNTPTSSTIYRESWGAYRNAFTEAGLGFGHTVRVGEGGYRFSARIDHILASDHWRSTECWVGPAVGSDHRPVIARFQYRGSAMR